MGDPLEWLRIEAPGLGRYVVRASPASGWIEMKPLDGAPPLEARLVELWIPPLEEPGAESKPAQPFILDLDLRARCLLHDDAEELVERLDPRGLEGIQLRVRPAKEDMELLEKLDSAGTLLRMVGERAVVLARDPDHPERGALAAEIEAGAQALARQQAGWFPLPLIGLGRRVADELRQLRKDLEHTELGLSLMTAHRALKEVLDRPPEESRPSTGMRQAVSLVAGLGMGLLLPWEVSEGVEGYQQDRTGLNDAAQEQVRLIRMVVRSFLEDERLQRRERKSEPNMALRKAVLERVEGDSGGCAYAIALACHVFEQDALSSVVITGGVERAREAKRTPKTLLEALADHLLQPVGELRKKLAAVVEAGFFVEEVLIPPRHTQVAREGERWGAERLGLLCDALKMNSDARPPLPPERVIRVSECPDLWKVFEKAFGPEFLPDLLIQLPAPGPPPVALSAEPRGQPRREDYPQELIDLLWRKYDSKQDIKDLLQRCNQSVQVPGHTRSEMIWSELWHDWQHGSGLDLITLVGRSAIRTHPAARAWLEFHAS